MLHFIRFMKHLVVFCLVVIPLIAVGWVILPIALYFIPKEEALLPWYLRWFDIVDTYVGRDTSTYDLIRSKGYWTRLIYIAFQNPINYFAYMYLGLRWSGLEVYSRYNKDESQIGDTSLAGFRYIEVNAPGNIKYYEYYCIYQYPIFKNHCLRYRLGWKIKDKNNKPGSISQWVFVISPWHSYTGK